MQNSMKKGKAMKRITCGWQQGGKNVCLKLAESWQGTKTKYWSKELGGRKKSTYLRRNRKPWLGNKFLCWLISHLCLFDQVQKFKLRILPWRVYCKLCNRQEIPSSIPSLPLCPLMPSAVPCVLQPKRSKQLSQQGGSSQENVLYLHPMCTV